MKLTRIFIALLLLIPVAVMAQSKAPADIEPDLLARGGTVPIPDAGYDGTLGSMACVTSTQSFGSDLFVVEDASVTVSMEHTWVGDLTMKLVSPSGTVATVLSRPGYSEPADDGTGCCGNSANLVLTDPITFSTTNGLFDAETMGGTLGSVENVCADDGECSFIPNPGSAVDSGNMSTIFDGETASGDWQFCVGDGAGGDTGNLSPVTLVLEVGADIAPVPTLNWIGLMVLMLGLGGLGMVLMRRRQQA